MINQLPEFSPSEILTPCGKEGKIGEGGFGTVRRCKLPNLKVAAIKYFESSEDSRTTENKSALREARILCKAAHKNIITIQGTCSRFMGIIMEYMAGGNLEDFLQKNKTDIPWVVRLKIALDIAEGIWFLHTYKPLKHLVHGDLKPQNVLLTHKLVAKLADFGAVDMIVHPGASQTQLDERQKPEYTPLYSAPEFLQNTNCKRTCAMDIYSFGMILYEIITRSKIFENSKVPQPTLISVIIERGQRPDEKYVDCIEGKLQEHEKDVFKMMKDAMKKCWAQEADQRPKAEKVVSTLKSELQKVDEKSLDEMLTNLAEQLNLKEPDLDNYSLITLEQFFKEKSISQPCASGSTASKSLLVVGGQATKTDAIRFEPLTKEWTELPSLTFGRYDHCSAVVDDKLFVMGGACSGRVLGSVECLAMKAEEKAWEVICEMNEPRYQASAEAVKSTIYVCGGRNEKDKVLNSIECLNVNKDVAIEEWRWTKMTIELKEARYNLSTFSIHGLIFCCGGASSSNQALDSVEKIDPALQKVERSKKLDTARIGGCAACVGDAALLLGGMDKEKRKIINSTSYFDGSEWKPHKNMIKNRSSFACAAINKTVYAVGGHGINEKVSSLSSIEQINLEGKEPDWSETVKTARNKRWAGHTVVAW